MLGSLLGRLLAHSAAFLLGIVFESAVQTNTFTLVIIAFVLGKVVDIIP